MRVLTARAGQLASVLLCGSCQGGHAVTLDTGHVVPSLTVADRDDITADDVLKACSQLLHNIGWDGLVDDAEGLAAAMAAETVEVAAEHAVSTRLHPQFDHDTVEWSYTAQWTRESCCAASFFSMIADTLRPVQDLHARPKFPGQRGFLDDG